MLMQMVKAEAEMVDNRIQRLEDFVADVVFAQVIPEVFDGIKFRAVGWEGQQVEGGGNLQGSGGVPTSAIQQHQAMLVGKAGGDVSQEQGHGFGIHPGQDQRAELSIERADGSQTVDELPDDLVADDGAQGPRGPAATLVADAAETGFVLKQQAHPCLGRKPSYFLGEDVGEFFLNRSCTAGWALGCRGRGPSLRQPCRCSSR